MINRIHNLEAYDKLEKWIPRIVECLNSEKANEHHVEFVNFLINLFYWVAKNEDKSDIALEYKEILSKKLNKYLKLNKESPPTKIEDHKDLLNAVNYVFVWVKNNFDIDVDNTSIYEIQEKQFFELDSKTSSSKENNSAANVYKNLLNADVSDENIEDMKKGIKIFSSTSDNAHSQLKQEIKDGKIYIYKTKPKWNPIFKKVLCCVFGVGIILSITWFIFAIAPVLNSAGDKNVWSIVMSVMNLLFWTYATIETAKSNLNDNYKYLFDKSLFIYQFMALWIHTLFVALNHSFLENPMHGLSISLIPLHAVALFMNAYGVFSLNPSKDEKLINDLSSKYSEDDSLKKKNTKVK